MKFHAAIATCWEHVGDGEKLYMLFCMTLIDTNNWRLTIELFMKYGSQQMIYISMYVHLPIVLITASLVAQLWRGVRKDKVNILMASIHTCVYCGNTYRVHVWADNVMGNIS